MLCLVTVRAPADVLRDLDSARLRAAIDALLADPPASLDQPALAVTSVRIDDATLAALDALAARLGCSRSRLLALAAERWADTHRR